MTRSFSGWLSIACLTLTAPLAIAQEVRTFVVRGQEYQLQAHPDLVAVRPRGDVKSMKSDALNRLADQVVRAQYTTLKQPPKIVPGITGRPVRLASSVLAPRVKGLEGKQLPAVTAALRLEADEIVPVYRVVGRAGRSDVPRKNQPLDMLVLTTNQVLARFEVPPTEMVLLAIEKDLKLKRVPPTAKSPSYAANTFRFQRLPGAADPFVICDALRGRGGVRIRWAQPEFVHEFARAQLPSRQNDRIPTDPLYAKQWHLHADKGGLDMAKAWAITLGNDRAVVAVVDDGVDTAHPEFQGRLVPGLDVSKPEPDQNPIPAIVDSHGTSCAGLIGGAANNGLGTAGIAWNCKIMPIRIAGEDGFASDVAIAESMAWAFNNGARIFSCSWGAAVPFNPILDIVDQIHANGGLVFAAAGNAGTDVMFPAAHPPCVAIGALRPDNTIWDYSCRGPGLKVSLVAPSSDGRTAGIWTVDHAGPYGANRGGPRTEEPTGDYTGRFSGTSAATPITAGVAALLWSTYPQLTAQQVRDCLEQTAQKIDQSNGDWQNGRSVVYGYGKVDPVAALGRAADLAKSTPRRSFARPGIKFADGPTYDVLASLADRTDKVYLVRGQSVTLAVDPTQLAVVAELDLVKGMLTGDTKTVSEIGKTADGPVCLVNRTAWPQGETLTKALPKIVFASPVYKTKTGDLVAPTGILEIRLIDPTTRTEALRYCHEAGLRAALPTTETADRLVVRIGRESKCLDLFDAARMLSEQPFVRWAQPEFVTRLMR